MYQVSRSIYRELADRVIEDPADRGAAKQRLLSACEAAVTRLALDPRYFRRPTRSLFGEVRTLFGINDQMFVYRVIDRYMNLAGDYFPRLPSHLGPLGEPRRCHATTRRGTPCQRDPLPGREYCPSHKHLEETDEVEVACVAEEPDRHRQAA